jgi:outer membrane receptor protein involved in Fe transport
VQRNQGLDSSFDLPERSVSTNWRENSLRFSLLSVLSENSFNEARLSLSRKRYRAEAVNQNYAILVFDFFNAGGNQESLFLDGASRNLRAENNFTRIAGNHSLKFGVSASAISYESTDRTNFGGTFIFGSDFERNDRGFPVSIYSYVSPLESYQLTLLRRVGYRPLQFSINQGDPFAALTQWEGAIFAQDDWRVSERLTVSLGLRAETQTNLKGVNFAPRAALAVRPFKNVEGVLRVGAGIFYSRVDSGITLDAIRYDGSRVEELVVQRPPFFPTVPAVLNRAVALTTIRTKSPDLTAPYNFISTISYWQQLSKNFNATISYNWQRGVHLLRTRNVNAPIPGSNNLRPNDALGAILQYESTGNLKRHDFNFGLQGSLTDKFSFYGNYRLAFADSDTDGAKTAAANSYDLIREWGRSAFDQRHQFYFESYVQLPFGIYFSPNVFIASGAPFNILTGRDDNSDTLFTDRPAFANPGDAGAFATRFGTFNLNPQAGDRIIPRNYGRGASQVSVNFNLSKTLFFGAEKGGQNARINQGNCSSGVLQKVRCGLDRRYGLTFSADVYNVINRTNFIEFNNVATSPKFGLPNRAADARRFQLGMSLSF